MLHLASVTVIAPSCVQANAIAMVMMAMKLWEGLVLVDCIGNIDALFNRKTWRRTDHQFSKIGNTSIP